LSRRHYINNIKPTITTKPSQPTKNHTHNHKNKKPKDARVMSQVAEYFNRAIPEVAHDDEDGFIRVLNEAGLTDSTA
jgi:hypothetical protein